MSQICFGQPIPIDTRTFAMKDTPPTKAAAGGPKPADVAALFKITINPATDAGGFVSALVDALESYLVTLRGGAAAVPAAPARGATPAGATAPAAGQDETLSRRLGISLREVRMCREARVDPVLYADRKAKIRGTKRGTK